MKEQIAIPNRSKEMVKLAYQALSDKKAIDIRIIDISAISTIADYFIIANGSNSNQIGALVDNVEESLYKAGFRGHRKEGYRNDSWILLDYNDLIIHIFDDKNRSFYNLERIWSDGKAVDIQSV